MPTHLRLAPAPVAFGPVPRHEPAVPRISPGGCGAQPRAVAGLVGRALPHFKARGEEKAAPQALLAAQARELPRRRAQPLHHCRAPEGQHVSEGIVIQAKQRHKSPVAAAAAAAAKHTAAAAACGRGRGQGRRKGSGRVCRVTRAALK